MAQFQEGIFSTTVKTMPQMVETWDASIRATHYIVVEANIEIFRPIVQNPVPALQSACMRDTNVWLMITSL